MDKALTNSIIRFVLLWALQVFLLKQIYWGWGGEDDDMYDRCQREETGFERRPNRYRSLSHERQILTQEAYGKNLQRLHSQRNGGFTHKEEGLNTLTYTLLSEEPLQFTARKYTVSL